MKVPQLFLLGFVSLLGACHGQKKSAMQQEVLEMNERLELLISDEYSGAEVSETMIIRNSKTLRSFFSQINKTRKPGLPVPNVDFEKEVVIVACSAERNDGALPVLRVAEVTQTNLVLSIALQSDNKNTTTAITSPFSIYKLPLTEKEITIRPSEEFKNN